MHPEHLKKSGSQFARDLRRSKRVQEFDDGVVLGRDALSGLLIQGREVIDAAVRMKRCGDPRGFVRHRDRMSTAGGRLHGAQAEIQHPGTDHHQNQRPSNPTHGFHDHTPDESRTRTNTGTNATQICAPQRGQACTRPRI